MEKTTELKDINVAAERKRLRSLFENMLAEKKEEQQNAGEIHNDDPEYHKALHELRKRNAERGTPVIRL